MTDYKGPDLSKLIAILRGVRPDEAITIAETLISAGITTLEVPLNSPSPLQTIERLVTRLGDQIHIGAGTVVQVEQVQDIQSAGAAFFLTPNVNAQVIQKSVALKLPCIAGFSTPTEAFTALANGASALKLFPASHYGTTYLQAIRAVLPADTQVVAVGGVNQHNAQSWLGSGANSVGIGSSLYAPDINLEELHRRGQLFSRLTKEHHYA